MTLFSSDVFFCIAVLFPFTHRLSTSCISAIIFFAGEEHLDTARAYYGLGCALRILGSTTEALENLRKAYHIQVRSHASQQDKERTERELQHLSGMQAGKYDIVAMIKEQ